MTFLCQSSSPLSLPSFLWLTLFSALSFGSNSQVVEGRRSRCPAPGRGRPDSDSGVELGAVFVMRAGVQV